MLSKSSSKSPKKGANGSNGCPRETTRDSGSQILSQNKRTVPRRPVDEDGDEDEDEVGLEGLTLRSPIASPPVRRSGRKKVPTERLKLALEGAVDQIHDSSELVNRLDFDNRVADLNKAACATDVESDTSVWTPSTSTSRAARGRPRPRAIPRSKWNSPPCASTSNSRCDGNHRELSLPRSISSGEYLPTTAELFQDLQTAKDPEYSDRPDSGEEALTSDDGKADGSEGYASWHGIEDGRRSSDDEVLYDHQDVASDNQYEDFEAEDDDFEDQTDNVEKRDDSLERRKSYWEEEEMALERDCYLDRYDLGDSFIGDDESFEDDVASDNGNISGDEGASDIDSMMEELALPFGNVRGDQSAAVPSHAPSTDPADQVFYEDLPPIVPQRNGSFRSRSKRPAPPTTPPGQQKLGFARTNDRRGKGKSVAPSPSRYTLERKVTLDTDDEPFRTPSSSKFKPHASRQLVARPAAAASSPSPTKKRRLRQASSSPQATGILSSSQGTAHASTSRSTSTVPMQASYSGGVAPNHNASGSSSAPTAFATSTTANQSVPAATAHVFPTSITPVSAPIGTAVAPAPIVNPLAPTANAIAPPLAVAPVPVPAPVPAPALAPPPPPATAPGSGREPALNVELQHPRLQAMYAALPPKARVFRATMLNYNRELPPIPRPLDVDYAFSLLSDPRAEARFNAAITFDSWGRVLNINRNGNLPVTKTREGVFVSIAGRRVPAVWVTTGFSWTSDLQGVGDGKFPAAKKLHVRQISQEFELFQGALGSFCNQVCFHAQCDQRNGAAAFCTKKRPTQSEGSSNGGRPGQFVESGTGTGRALAPLMAGSSNSPAGTLPEIFTKIVRQYDDDVPVFDGRSSRLNGDAGFMFTPQDWENLESLPRFQFVDELPENTLVTVGFSVSAFGPFNNTMQHWGVVLNLMFIIVLDSA
ncbi:hypothetical protein AAF712_012695 [Marasmius tenuissimus]|uniref:Uncharacterized protein n=1 Tax=Marasmius tenuissimus TaxID=585030 RepID=A0ABR2ZGM8_9AGAR